MITLTDDYGKRTMFNGVRLVADTTDTRDGEKPQWTEMDIWRTEAGAYVICRRVCYRYRHISDTCSRLGPNLLARPATEGDTYPCSRCNRAGAVEPGQGYGVEDRVSVDVARSPADLIRILANQDGSYSGFCRAALADISEQDAAVAALWLEEVVP